ncbi:multicopper oxidase domain-containing protein [Microbispora sp. NPDC088329]|uniref:multicopper oxidase domain-containing protein n=1 Tax=Microbispora sp. NPDC088329 TaxID=3154869 RepID=UPI00341F95F1
MSPSAPGGCTRATAGSSAACRSTITRFDGYRGRYLFHCHNAEHEDMGMMANLEIV